jgi:alkaline phosphatase D
MVERRPYPRDAPPCSSSFDPPPDAEERQPQQYRSRHAQHRKDPDLQALHARHPVVAIWDDHDIVGGAWRDGASRHDARRHGPWDERVAAGRRAWREWVPTASADRRAHPHLYRRIALGSLAELVLLDTRHAGRDRPALGGWATLAILRRNRSMLGAEQWRWLEDELTAPAPPWTLVGTSVVMAPLRAMGNLLLNPDQWDGYPGERRRLLELLAAHGRQSPVVLAGDLHSSWATELPHGSAVELVTPAVSAPSMAEMLLAPVPGLAELAARWFRLQNRGVRFSEINGHGYLVVELDRDRLRAEWWHVDQVRHPGAAQRCVAAFQTTAGSGRLVEADLPPPTGYEPGEGDQAALSPSAESSGKVR